MKTKKMFTAPKITVQELSLRTLLGENGWLAASKNQYLAYIPT